MTFNPNEKPYPTGTLVRRKGTSEEGMVVGWFPPGESPGDPPDLTGPGSGVVVRFNRDHADDQRLRYEDVEFVATVGPE